MNAALSPVQSSFDARALLAEFFGYESFRPGQEETIRSIAQGGSTLAVMPTGSGKSLCYQLPALAAHGVTLVISPLIALMKDQIDELARLRIPAAFINSTLSLEAQRDRIAAVMAGEYRLLYVAPERFRSAAFRRMLEQASVPIVAVDEAHCVSEWGHDFRPDYLRLRGFFQSIAPASIVALTATATPKVQRDIVEQLGLGEARVIVTGFDRPNLLLAARRFVYDQEKQRFLLQFVRSRAGSGIVYAGSRRAAEELSDLLYSHGETVRCYHAGMKDADREEAQNAFMAGQARLIVATNAFGMGIDKPDIRFVFHYSMPGSAEAYYQEAGRAGRDGQPAECVLCSSPADYRLREFFIEQSYPAPEKIEAVYETLCGAGQNPVLMSPERIGRETGMNLREPAVNSCLRILENAGALQRLDPRQYEALIFLREPAAKARKRLKKTGPARQWFDALADALDLDEPGSRQFILDALARRMSLSPAELERQIEALAAESALEYHEPFRGQGIRLLNGKPAFEEIEIDWESLDRRRQAEYEKLNAIQSYVGAGGCRREWIVGYFGQKTLETAHCQCDRCEGDGIDAPRTLIRPGAEAEGYGPEEADSAMAVLRCAEETPWPLGLKKLAQLASGTQARWALDSSMDDLPSYGAANLQQARVEAIAERLARDGFFRLSPGKYPTAKLTPAGEALLAGQAQLPPRADWLAAAPAGDGRDAQEPKPAKPMSESELFHALRELRAAEAKRRRTQAFKILSDGALRHMAKLRPASSAELASIKGIGPEKLKKFGGLFLEEIRRLTEGAPARPAESLDSALLADSAPPAAVAPCAACPCSVSAESPPPMPDPAAVLRDLIHFFLAAEREEAQEAFRRLKLFDRTAIWNGMEAAWERAADERSRTRLIWAAGEIGAEGAERWLVARLAEPSPVERRLACESLRKRPGRQTEAALVEALLDRDEAVQASAAAALGEIGGRPAQAALDRMRGSKAIGGTAADAIEDAISRIARRTR